MIKVTTASLLGLLLLSTSVAMADPSKADIQAQKKGIQDAIEKDRQKIEALREEVNRYEAQIKVLNQQIHTISEANIATQKAHQLEVKAQHEAAQQKH